MPNNWEIKKCLYLSLVILLASLGLVGLASLGYNIPGLRQIVGFIFLTFIPGILILRILKVHNVGTIESLLYSVGLSLAFVVFSGVLVNFALPLVGVSRPISALPIMFTLVVFTLILAAIAYWRDRDFSAPTADFHLGEILSPSFLLLLTLPLLAILGATMVNLYQNNLVLLFFIVVVCCVVALVAFDKLPQKAYALALVMVAISLLLHSSLISSQLWGYDIRVEYSYQSLVAQNGYWNFAIPSNVNTCLSIVMLAPIYSLILNMDAIWLFKIIYPVIFALVPVALFHIYREQIGSKRAFFSAFFFTGTWFFFVEMTTLVRQQIAELFFVLLILLLVDRKLALRQRTTLAIVFALSLVVSHYALGYICSAFLIGAWFIVALMRTHRVRRAWEWLTRGLGMLPQDAASERAFPLRVIGVVIGTYLLFALCWYGSVASGTALDRITQIGIEQHALLSTEFTQPTPTSIFPTPTLTEPLVFTALGLDFFLVSPLGKTFRIFQYITQFLIIAGFVSLFFKREGYRFKAEYVALTMVAALILFLCIVLPRFSSYIQITRFYHITLILLSPLLILGGETIWRGVSKGLKSFSSRLKANNGQLQKRSRSLPLGTSNSAYLKFLALAVLIPYFLFNSGFVFEVSGSKLEADTDKSGSVVLNSYTMDMPYSIALSSYRIDLPVFNDQEVAGADWTRSVLPYESTIYVDEYGQLIVGGCLFPAGIENISGDAYIYLRTWNIEKRELLRIEYLGTWRMRKHTNLPHSVLEDRNKIYDNGGCQILAPRQSSAKE